MSRHTGPATPILILQINLNGSIQATESALDLAIELGVHLICGQEPWFSRNQEQNYTNTRTISHPSFNQIIPKPADPHCRPRTATWVRRDLPFQVTQGPLPSDPDIQLLDIIEGKKTTRLINIYNEKAQTPDNHLWTLSRTLFTQDLLLPDTVLLGDFNSHHPSWDPTGPAPSQRDKDLRDWLDEKNFTLGNTIGVGTFFRANMEQESTLDLVFTRGRASSRIHDWQTLPPLGSDHLGILFSLTNQEGTLVPTQRFNIDKANWTLFAEILKQGEEQLHFNIPPESSSLDLLQGKPTTDTEFLDVLVKQFTSLIQEAAQQAIPLQTLSPKSKPWWNPTLKEHRKALNRAYRAMHKQKTEATVKAYKEAKSLYFQEIKTAKRQHWP